MKIFYWAPWIGKVGTIKAVINSADILEKYSKIVLKQKLLMLWVNGKNMKKRIDI